VCERDGVECRVGASVVVGQAAREEVRNFSRTTHAILVKSPGRNLLVWRSASGGAIDDQRGGVYTYRKKKCAHDFVRAVVSRVRVVA